MNNKELELYSFLMRESIEFVRYCHHPYKKRIEFEQLIHKSRHKTSVPKVKVYHIKNSTEFMICIYETVLPDSVETEDIPDNEKNPYSLIACTPETVTPLGLVFDTDHRFQVYIEHRLCNEKYLIFPACSETSSAVLSPKVFTENFLYKTGHEIIYY